MSMRTVRTFAEQIPRLQAMESLLALERIGTATGSAGEMGKTFIANWQRDIKGVEAPVVRVRPTADELRAKGIRVFGPKQASV